MTKTRPFIVFFSFFAISGLALAQERSDQPDQPTQSPEPPPQPQQQQQQPTPQIERPIYLSGKVIYDDGSPADTSVQVELVCNGRVRRRTHAFSGSFSLEVTQNNRFVGVMDASVSSQDAFGPINARPQGGMMGGIPGGGGAAPATGRSFDSGVDLMGCELRAFQAGFQSDVIPLAIVRPLDSPDVGVIVLHRAGSIIGTTTSVTSEAAPKKAKKAFKKAVKEVRKKNGNHEKAASELEKATELYPEYASAWELLGQIRLAQRDEPGARQAFESAVAGDPKFIRPNMVMMELEVQKQNWAEVSKWSSRVTELNPYLVLAHYYRGIASVKLNQAELAEESFQKVRDSYKRDEFPYAGYLLGYILADQGKFESAASELRHFLKIKGEALEVDRIKSHLAAWEKEGRIKSTKN